MRGGIAESCAGYALPIRRESKTVRFCRREAQKKLNLFGNFRFGTGYLEMRCSKSCYLYDLELVDLFENAVIE